MKISLIYLAVLGNCVRSDELFMEENFDLVPPTRGSRAATQTDSCCESLTGNQFKSLES